MIILIFMDALEHVQHHMSWIDFVDMDREDFLETQGKNLLELEEIVRDDSAK